MMELLPLKEADNTKPEDELVLSDNTTQLTDDLVKCDSYNAHDEVTMTTSYSSLTPVEREQPKPLCDLLPAGCCTVQHAIQSKSQDSFKTTMVPSTPPEEAGTCAAALLACLFCQPVDCLLASVKGCSECVWWFCSSICGCDPCVLQMLHISLPCEICAWAGSQCSQCPLCDICLQATECLDLCMEISQMLYH